MDWIVTPQAQRLHCGNSAEYPFLKLAASAASVGFAIAAFVYQNRDYFPRSAAILHLHTISPAKQEMHYFMAIFIQKIRL